MQKSPWASQHTQLGTSWLQDMACTAALAAAFRSGRRSWPAMSSTPQPRTTRARRSARPCWKTTTSACTTRRSMRERWRYKPHTPELNQQPRETMRRAQARYGIWGF